MTGRNIDPKHIKTVVIKVGSSLVDIENHPTKGGFIHIAKDIAHLRQLGKRVILVSSGAIRAGMVLLGMRERPRAMAQKQAIAAIGQGRLMHFYKELFDPFGLMVAQVLLTQDDLRHRQRYFNAFNTLTALLSHHHILPIVNENDTVATEEIKFGDNDALSAIIASKMGAELLVLLTDTEGLCSGKGKASSNGCLITDIREITPEIEACAKGPGSMTSTGGMYTKVQAAKICLSAGIKVVIANGKRPSVLEEIFSGQEVGTYFHPQQRSLSPKKRWIAFGLSLKGKMTVDEGAEEALLARGKSLLPTGVVKVEGAFDRGDAVSIVGFTKKEIARGIANYSSGEMEKIKGLRSSEILNVLGYKNFDEVVHRDNMVIM